MKAIHFKTMKFHSFYSLLLAFICIGVIIIFPSISLAIASAFLVLYVAGNGVIHAKNGTLNRDSVLEYVLLSIVAIVLIVGAVF
jgi:hypothetical protein